MNNTSGVHIASVGSATGYGDYLQACLDAGYPAGLVKAVDTDGVLMQAKSVSQDTITIYRCKIDGDDFPPANWYFSNSAECLDSAEQWMEACDAIWNPLRDIVDYFELVNEPNMASMTQVNWFIEWTRYCMDIAADMNYKLAIGSFSTGCPPEEHMVAMLDLVEEICQLGHILAMHDGPVDGQTFQATASTATSANTSLRYRYWQELARVGGKRFPTVAITENYNYAPVNDAYMADFSWYLKELAKDGVIGAAWYTLGDDDPWPNRAGKPLAKYTNMVTDIDWGAIIPPEPEPIPDTWKQLNVPYANQNNPTSANLTPNDCGPACEAMVGAYLGEEHTVNEWYQATGAGTGYITIAQLIKAANVMGFTMEVLYNQSLSTLRTMIDNGVAPIILVNSSYLDHEQFAGPHFVVVVGYCTDGTFKVHDPNFYINDGWVNGGAFTLQTRLDTAWSTCYLQGNPNYVAMTLKKGYVPPNVKPALSGVGVGSTQQLTPAELEAVSISKVQAVKLLTTGDPDTDAENYNAVRDKFVVARLFFVPNATDLDPFSPQVFCDTVMTSALRLYSLGVRYFEVHNEPNLYSEGWSWNWANGNAFAAWFNECYLILRRSLPYAKLGFPGVSPQADNYPGAYQSAVSFLQQATYAINGADWLAVHNYWNHEGADHWGMWSEDYGGLWHRVVQRMFPSKEMLITEFSNNGLADSDWTKGDQYKRYYPALTGVKSVFAFALSWPGQDGNREGWTRNGIVTDIPKAMA